MPGFTIHILPEGIDSLVVRIFKVVVKKCMRFSRLSFYSIFLRKDVFLCISPYDASKLTRYSFGLPINNSMFVKNIYTEFF